MWRSAAAGIPLRRLRQFVLQVGRYITALRDVMLKVFCTANVGLVKDRTSLIRRVEMVRLNDMINTRIHS